MGIEPTTRGLRYRCSTTELRRLMHCPQDYSVYDMCVMKIQRAVNISQRVCIGVFVHNEEKHLVATLTSILAQETELVEIAQVLVISSGSTDETDAIVRDFARTSDLVRLIQEPERIGKSAAVNTFLQHADSSIVVTMSGDLVLAEDSIELLIAPFENQDVGMVGGRPIPTNTHMSRVGQELRVLWDLHHYISLIKPKCGELVAFRNIVRQIPKDSAVDEATLEVLLSVVGYQIVYAPEALVFNQVPETLADFFIQRRRVYTGHEWVRQTYNYRVSSMQLGYLYRAITAYLSAHPERFGYLVRLTLLECSARLLGWVDYYVFGKNPYVWKMVKR